MTDLASDLLRLREKVGAVRVERDALRVHGPDAISFLHGQCSQDVVGLVVGASAWSFVLQPQGKVDALVRLTRVGPDAVVVDVDGGWGDAVVARLSRFKLRVKADIDRLAWGCVALRGPLAASVAPPAVHPDGPVVVDAGWPGVPGVDVLGPDVAVPDGVDEVGAEAYEVLRIEAGVPAMGRELDDRTIPAETGLVERAVSFTKGCYTGQELVARIDSRGGHVPRHLRGLVLPLGPVAPGSEIRSGATVVGTVTSCAASGRDGAVALGYVSRNLAPPAEATVGPPPGAPVLIRTLPLIG